MLATLVRAPFDRAGWIFEPKWDGYRAIAEIQNGKIEVYSRKGNSFNEQFAPIVHNLRHLKHDTVLDGEVVVLDEAGRSRFQLLQQHQKTGQGRLVYYVFDILHLDGRDLQMLPLIERKTILSRLLRRIPEVIVSEHIEGRGEAFFRAAAAQGLEGIIAKNGQSPYRQGIRSADWLKIKTQRRQEAVIGGFTEPRGSRKNLGALLLGVYQGNDLKYIGHTGGGLNTKSLAHLRQRLDPLEQSTSPFAKRPKANAPVHWVKPQLVCEVTFQEWTDDGHMRHPIFIALREDKPSREVRHEVEHPVAELANNDPPLTNLGKIYWPRDGYTKGDLINYYREIAPFILPYLNDRPQSQHRHPEGIDGDSFFQKDVSKRPPPAWVKTTVVPHKERAGSSHFIVCDDQRTLLYLANLGCIEINPWNSRVGLLDRPDYLVIDLDPEQIAFAKVVEAALAVRKVLDAARAECYCKTSGKTGLHVYVPLGAKYPEDLATRFAEVVANIVNRKLPATTSVVRMPARRQGRVYLDFLQNRHGQTLAAPYSVRPVDGAPVSAPLKWSEVRTGLDPAKFTIKNTPKRLEKIGDLWQPVLGPGIDLAHCIERLARVLARAG
ncbi:MAG: DNA ligase D [Gemmataceae bacterium]